jgi:hypothetical protein
LSDFEEQIIVLSFEKINIIPMFSNIYDIIMILCPLIFKLEAYYQKKKTETVNTLQVMKACEFFFSTKDEAINCASTHFFQHFGVD